MSSALKCWQLGENYQMTMKMYVGNIREKVLNDPTEGELKINISTKILPFLCPLLKISESWVSGKVRWRAFLSFFVPLWGSSIFYHGHRSMLSPKAGAASVNAQGKALDVTYRSRVMEHSSVLPLEGSRGPATANTLGSEAEHLPLLRAQLLGHVPWRNKPVIACGFLMKWLYILTAGIDV